MLVALAAKGAKSTRAKDFANVSRARPQIDCGMTPRYLKGFVA
jgi:hypothetical protein